MSMILDAIPLSREQNTVFFLSTGRAGSTMVAKMLALNNNIHAVHELKPHLFDLRKTVYESRSYDDPTLIDKIFCGERKRNFLWATFMRKIFVDASPFLSFFAPALSNFFLKSKFAFIHRSPQDFVRSGMRRGWYKNHINDPLRLAPREDSEEFDLWREWSRFEKICWLWNEYNKVCLEIYDNLKCQKILISSDDLWDRSGVTARKLFDWVGVIAPDDYQIQEMLKKPINAQINGDFPNESEWSTDQIDALKKITGSTMKILGY